MTDHAPRHEEEADAADPLVIAGEKYGSRLIMSSGGAPNLERLE